MSETFERFRERMGRDEKTEEFFVGPRHAGDTRALVFPMMTLRSYRQNDVTERTEGGGLDHGGRNEEKGNHGGEAHE